MRDWVQAAFAKQMDLGYEAPDEPVEVEGNPVMLREMLSNLIDNAIRYTPAGGRITVRVRHEKAARLVHLEVEDTGLGIPVAERSRVIERFYRILGREGDGSGLWACDRSRDCDDARRRADYRRQRVSELSTAGGNARTRQFACAGTGQDLP